MKQGFALVAAGLAVVGCATDRRVSTTVAERLSVAVGPCYGTCPVYAIDLAPDGTGRFAGKEHVAVSGERAFHVDRTAQRDLLAALAPFRPASGTTADTKCAQQVSDQPTYTITWTGADGRATTLNHDRGCLSPDTVRLNAILTRLPDDLRIRALIDTPAAAR